MNSNQRDRVPFRDATSCDHVSLEQLLQGELPEQVARTIESHLEFCEQCRNRYDEMAASAQDWNDLRASLQHAECKNPRLSNRESWGSASVVLQYLSPTDEPEMLGRLGPYEIQGIVGYGGMGVVLKGWERSLNRSVAIKVLAPHLAASGAARQRFMREARAAAAVIHENVVAIHGVAEQNGLPYLVMPYSPGTTLQKRVEASGALQLNEILRIALQTARGLTAAHAQGLVHRDVKPANILLDQGVERVQLTDFGLARAVDDASMTRTGVLSGTPQYMSPEQVRADTIDARSDLFSLGSTMYTMSTGRPPFRAESSYAILRQITDQEPRAMVEINPAVPVWLCTIVTKLMSKHPEDRFRSGIELAELLEKCLLHVEQPTVAPLPQQLFHTQRKPISKFVHLLAKGVLAMIAILSCFYFVMLAWQGVPTPDESGEALQGVWELAAPASELHPDQRLRIVFTNDRYATYRGITLVSMSHLRIEPQYNPKRLHFRDAGGAPMRGIFEVKGDGLRLSIAPDADALPTKFGTEHPEFKRVNITRAGDLLKRTETATFSSNAGPLKVMNVDDIVAQIDELVDSRKQIRVTFEVKSAVDSTRTDANTHQTSIFMLGSSPYQLQQDALVVVLPKDVVDAHKWLGIKDLSEHYLGKFIEVTGRVDRTYQSIYGQSDESFPTMNIVSVDQLVILEAKKPIQNTSKVD